MVKVLQILDLPLEVLKRITDQFKMKMDINYLDDYEPSRLPDLRLVCKALGKAATMSMAEEHGARLHVNFQWSSIERLHNLFGNEEFAKPIQAMVLMPQIRATQKRTYKVPQLQITKLVPPTAKDFDGLSVNEEALKAFGVHETDPSAWAMMVCLTKLIKRMPNLNELTLSGFFVPKDQLDEDDHQEARMDEERGEDVDVTREGLDGHNEALALEQNSRASIDAALDESPPPGTVDASLDLQNVSQKFVRLAVASLLMSQSKLPTLNLHFINYSWLAAWRYEFAHAAAFLKDVPQSSTNIRDLSLWVRHFDIEKADVRETFFEDFLSYFAPGLQYLEIYGHGDFGPDAARPIITPALLRLGSLFANLRSVHFSRVFFSKASLAIFLRRTRSLEDICLKEIKVVNKREAEEGFTFDDPQEWPTFFKRLMAHPSCQLRDVEVHLCRPRPPCSSSTLFNLLPRPDPKGRLEDRCFELCIPERSGSVAMTQHLVDLESLLDVMMFSKEEDKN